MTLFFFFSHKGWGGRELKEKLILVSPATSAPSMHSSPICPQRSATRGQRGEGAGARGTAARARAPPLG